MMFCCKEFFESMKAGDFEHDTDGTWNVRGCGGCFVLQEVRFCPFCGKILPIIADDLEQMRRPT
jgi:rRNA maturation endonuclease Nob1